MFTGIITCIGRADLNGSTLKIYIDDPNFIINLRVGDSVCVNGICLTVTEIYLTIITFFVAMETQKKATIVNGHVNLERAVKLNSDISGHLITGHINNTGKVTCVENDIDSSVSIWIKLTNKMALKYKDGISINGTSLTIAEIDGDLFKICLIPYTIKNTTFKYLRPGDTVNIEYDIVRSSNQMNYMKRAIELGELGRQMASPNPWVGCVIVNHDIIIGEGYHRGYGKDHAEVDAIKNAIDNGNKDLIKGSTLYVTLEPCHHHGKTPPCDKLLVDNMISKVVIGCIDPDRKVNSNGMLYLRQNGVEVEIDVDNKSFVFESLKAYLHQRKTDMPYCIMKVGISIDGCIATETGDSKWITNEKSRSDVQKLRSESHAIIVGSNTVLKDNPMLNIRDKSLNISKQPYRVILDTMGNINDENSNILNAEIAPTIIFTSKEPKDRVKGINYKIINTKNGRLDLFQVLKHLNDIGIIQCLIEGGSSVYTSFLEEGLVQEVYLYQSNLNIGISGMNWTNCVNNSSVNNIQRWNLVSTKTFDNDVLIRYTIPKANREGEQPIKNTIQDAINALREGKPVIIMDSPDRENEGDLVVAAELITPETVAFLMRHTTGIICVSLTKDRADRLKLGLMMDKNEDPNGTNFTISCDSKGSKTGISAKERARTIKLLSNDAATYNDLTRPGHVFPLIAHSDGLIARRGHTEASTTLCKISGLKPVSAIAELVNADGTVMRYNNCEKFARTHNIPLITIEDMIKYCNLSIQSKPDIVKNDSFLPVTDCDIMTKEYGEWRLICYPSSNDTELFYSTNRAMVKCKDKLSKENIIIVRVHSDCYTGDSLGSILCDCGDQLKLSMEIINKNGVGVIIFPECHEGRGIGLVNKIKAYNIIKTNHCNTFEANNKLGFADDLRSYDVVPKILDQLKIKHINLLTNNKTKILCLEKYIKMVTPLEVEYNKHNIEYMKVKTNRYGHKQLIPENTIKVSGCRAKYSVGIIITDWHSELLTKVVDKIKYVLNEYSITDIQEYTIPGSFEIPFAAKKIIEHGKHNIIICIGLIIKGETAHFEYISQATINGIMNVQLASTIPIINGVLNCYNMDQAIERCSSNSGLGVSLAKSAISMLKLIETL